MTSREMFSPSAAEGVPQTESHITYVSAKLISLLRRESRGRAYRKISGIGRHTLGILLLLVTVVLWTSSNFLASFIFADDTYSKPFFLTYINAAFFATSLIPLAIRRLRDDGPGGFAQHLSSLWKRPAGTYSRLVTSEDEHLPKTDQDDEGTSGTRITSRLLVSEDERDESPRGGRLAPIDERPLTVQETVALSLKFCILWFLANYSAAACLAYTTVASATIVTSTSSIWTLLFGTLLQVEIFSFKKLVGVLASLAGIVLISTVDLSGSTDKNRGSFPHKSTTQLAIGDSMALFSAIMYGVYTVMMKKRIGDEGRVSMPLFFGLVGIFTLVLLWPGFIVLHLVGEERFELPPTGQVWAIVLINSVTSLVSDYSWAYATLLTSPLVITVGLSLTIPLSLVGQMILESQYSSAAYWIGAGIVFLSFLFINHESKEEELASDLEPQIADPTGL